MARRRRRSTARKIAGGSRALSKPGPGVAPDAPAPSTLREKETPRWQTLGVSAFLAAITILIFGQTLWHDFVNFDDPVYVYDNPEVKGGLTWHGLIWAFTRVHTSNWHPLTWISHMLDSQLFGLNAGGHHATNVLLHALTAILLFLVLRAMTESLWRSAFVAALFAIHPLHVESVAWVSERKDVLSGLFFVLTLAAYLRYVRNPPSPGRYLAVVLAFALGLMSKAMLVTLPFVLLLLDYWPLQRFTAAPRIGRRVILEKLPLIALSVASSAATIFAQTDAFRPMQKVYFASRIENALVSCLDYLWQMVYPLKLAVLYPHPMNTLPPWKVAAAAALLVATSAGALLLRRKRPYLLVGWLWYLGMLVPVIGILQVGIQARADRYTYLPQIGLYLAATWAIADLSARWPRRRQMLAVTAGGLISVLSWTAWQQTAHWRDSESLWNRALAVTSRNDLAHHNLGYHFFLKGRLDEAIAQFKSALQIWPRYMVAMNNLGVALLKAGRPDEASAVLQRAIAINPKDARAHFNLGNVLMEKGQVDEAIAEYGKQLEITPDHVDTLLGLGKAFLEKGEVTSAIVHYEKVLQFQPREASAYYHLGIAHAEKNDAEIAIANWRKALEIKPAYAEAHNNLAIALLGNGDAGQAIAQWRKMLEIQPENADAHNNLGVALIRNGRASEAVMHWRKTLEIDPGKTATRMTLAWVLATSPESSLRNGAAAVELAEQAHQQGGGDNPMALRTLAAAYAETGRFSEALSAAQEGLRLATDSGDPALIETFASELALYRNNSPMRDANLTNAR